MKAEKKHRLDIKWENRKDPLDCGPHLKPLKSPVIWIKQQISKGDQLSCSVPSITAK